MSFKTLRTSNQALADFNNSAERVSVTSSITTDSVTEITYQWYTQGFFIRNNSSTGTLYFGFSSAGVNGDDKFTLGAGETISFPAGQKNIFVSGSGAGTEFSILAPLTEITASR